MALTMLIRNAAATGPSTSSSSSSSTSSSLSSRPEWLRGRAHPPTNPALRGNFAPVSTELDAPLKRLAIRGRVPNSVAGVYLRNGPNAAREPALGCERYHWFDGDGLVHAVRLRGGDDDDDDGSAEYTRRYVRTRGFERERDAGEALYTGLRDINPIWKYLLPRLFEKVTKDWRQPDSAFFVIQSKNTSSNSLVAHAGRLLSTFESGSAYELGLDPMLTTKGVCDFGGSFTTADFWGCNFTAHAKTCPQTGELVYMGYNLVALGPNQEGETTVTIGAIDAKTGKRSYRRDIKVKRPSMQHDLAITPTKAVLVDGPLVFDLPRVIQGGMPFSFEKRLTMRIGYLSRLDPMNDEVRWIDTGETCFAYHVVNAYEDGDTLTLDVCKSDETNALGMCEESDAPRREDEPNACVGAGRDVAALWRWEIDTKKDEIISSRRMCDTTSDFPCINRRYVGLKYRFAYSVAYKSGTEPRDRMDIPSFDAVLKHDMETGETFRYDLPPGVTCGDIIFVPEDGDDVAEDDGYLLVLTHIQGKNDDDGSAELLVLSTSGELTTQCAVEIPVRIPYGFHCEYVPEPLPDWPLDY